MTINQKLHSAIATAFEIDRLIAELNEQLGVLVGDMQTAKRPHEAGMLLIAKEPNSFYRRVGGRLQDMQSTCEPEERYDNRSQPATRT